MADGLLQSEIQPRPTKSIGNVKELLTASCLLQKTMQTVESLSLGFPEDSNEKREKTRSKARERVEIVLMWERRKSAKADQGAL
jgi:hypothetical protein